MTALAASGDVFHAVADGTRRAILDLLAEGEKAVMELVSRFRISQPAVSQHLRVLRDAGLVTARQHGRQRLYALNAEALRVVAQWLAHYERFWDGRIHRLGQYLDRTRPARSDDPRSER